MHLLIKVALLLASLASLAPAGVAQFGFGNPPVEARLFTRVEGDLVRAAIEFEIERGWHMYHDDKGHPDAIGKETQVVLRAADVVWSRALFPEPHRFDQSDIAGPGAYINGHEGTIHVYAVGRVGPGGAGGLEVEVKGQVCEEACLPFKELLQSAGPGPDAVFAAFPDDLAPPAEGAATSGVGDEPRNGSTPEPDATVAVGGSTSGASAGTVAPYPEFRVQSEASERSLAVWLLLAFIAGVILNVMPCVLPVISIKILSFVQQAGESRARVFQLGLAFSAGILIVFLALAGVAIVAGLSWGEQFQSDTFLVTMIAIVFALALSLFGVFDLGVPTGVGALQGVQREGLGDAFFKGMLATLLATPCSGPFLGSTLTWTLAQPPSVVFLIFLTLGLGMACPYIVRTANPAFLQLVPKPGAWMDTFKQGMGFLLLATVVYLMVSVRQDNLLFTLAFLVFVGIGCWWWGRFAKLDQTKPKRLSHLAIALGICALGARVSFVDFRGLFQSNSQHVAWQDFEQGQFLALLDEGRSVFVDFTADWCPNCKYNEAFVYESEPIRALLERKHVAAVKADMTDDAPAIEGLLESLGGRSIPFMAVFPGDRPFEPFVLPDVVTVAEVAELLEACPEPAVAAPPPND